MSSLQERPLITRLGPGELRRVRLSLLPTLQVT